MSRLLPFLCADGISQMAADEALLECSEEPTARVYVFNPPTLSLGCFQDYDAVLSTWPQVPGSVVRRITGGGAIWHCHEVTFALMTTAPSQERSEDWYLRIHQAVRKEVLLRGGHDLGLQSERRGDPRYRAEVRCFASPAAGDLIHAGAKVLGSAARRRGDRMLIHGSLKIAENPWDASAATGCGLNEAAAKEALSAALGKILPGPQVLGDWTPAEQAARERLSAERKTDAWIRERKGLRA
jgi:lipoate-protein ligase A